MNIVKSIDGFIIRLTDERWQHISTGHPEIADLYYELLQVIAEPEMIYDGGEGELIALKFKKQLNKHLVVVYKQDIITKDGFVITAFVSRKLNYLSKKNIVWKSPN